MDGKLASAYCLMGRAYDGLGRGEEASQAYAKAVAMDPEMVAAGLRLSELQGRGGMTAGLHEQGQVKGPVQDQRDTTAGVLVGGEP
jgi:tetratricopeptide (TPR) repeat protein